MYWYAIISGAVELYRERDDALLATVRGEAAEYLKQRLDAARGGDEIDKIIGDYLYA